MARADPQVNFRCPAELKDRIEKAAKANSRSLTAEIVQRLESTFAQTLEPSSIPSTSRVFAPTITNGASIQTEELEKALDKVVGEILRKFLSEETQKRK